MKIGGNSEFWMVIGPIIAVALLVMFTMGPDELVRTAERFANEGWETVVRTFRR
jgi:hypothetical protein